MTHSVFAYIYNPFTRSEIVYQEAMAIQSDVSLTNFENDSKYVLTKSDLTLEQVIQSVNLKDSDEISTTKDSFIKWVEQIQSLISKGDVDKIIAARKDVSEHRLNIEHLPWLIRQLIQKLPNTFVYLYSLKNCLWIGASPELIGRTSKGQFLTISLAGTTHTDQVQFGQKEQIEQSIVTNFIRSVLNKYGDSSVSQSNQALAFGSITHLRDEFKIPLQSPSDFNSLIDQIHPSPALSGNPKDLAIKKIIEQEPLKRDWYCGHTVFSEADEQYAFAMIRCAKITSNQITYFAGAGITKDSIPEMEYEETKSKINILKELIESKITRS